jgi:hypothetical protein
MDTVASEPVGNMEHFRHARILLSGISMGMGSSISPLLTPVTVCKSSWETGMEPSRGRQASVLTGHSLLCLETSNGDGKLDLVIDTTAAGLQILLGNGDGTFQNPRIIVQKRLKETGLGCGFGVPFVIGDFNGDGKIDVAYCSGAYAQIGIVLGNGDGTFKKPVYDHAGNNYSAWAFAAGDFNSDGKMDFIEWHFKNGVRDRAFAILLGNGDGIFQQETVVPLPANIEDYGIVTGDFNSDGLLDFVTLPGAGGIQVYTQQ